MPFSSFLKHGVWDMLFCALASGALAYTLCGGFYASIGFQSPPFVIAGACLALTVVFYCISYTTRTALAGAVGAVLLLGAVMVVCVMQSTSSSVFADEQGNLAIPALLVIVSCVAVFLLSRKRLTIAVLLIAGVFAAAVIEYLYWYHQVLPVVLFVLSAFALYAYRAYQHSLLNSESEKMSFAAVSLSGAVLAAVALALGFGIFSVIIAPLNPPSMQVKLVTEHFDIDTEELKGVGDTVTIQDNNLFSNNVTNDVTSGNYSPTDSQAQQLQTATQNGNSNDSDEEGTSGDAQGMLLPPPEVLIPIILGVILALILLAFLVKRLLRRRWHNGVAAQPNSARVMLMYRFFLGRFEKMKLSRPQGSTLTEFARNFSDTFATFEAPAPTVAFADLTNVYTKVVYGGAEASDDDCSLFERYYGAFYKNARAYIGKGKYCFRFFTM